jgi:hypothetical protein
MVQMKYLPKIYCTETRKVGMWAGCRKVSHSLPKFESLPARQAGGIHAQSGRWGLCSIREEPVVKKAMTMPRRHD